MFYDTFSKKVLCNDQMTFQLVRSILNIHENIKVKFPGMENTSKN